MVAPTTPSIQTRSPKKRKIPSSSPAPQSIPEPFDHGQQAPGFQRLQILQSRNEGNSNQNAHHHQVSQPGAVEPGVLLWPDISSGSENAGKEGTDGAWRERARERTRASWLLLGARRLLGWSWCRSR
uniref:Uncharacterized protein n=1 Tax=Arundo donax TaxID=35708 RepID=A0A0A9CSD3_ARUDO